MEETCKILDGAIGFDVATSTAHIAVPLMHPVERKGKWQAVNDVQIVTSDHKKWIVTQEAQQSKNVVVRRLPQFPIGKTYWKEKDITYYLDNEDAAHIDAYTEVFEPIQTLLDDLVDFHSPFDSALLAVWIMGTYLQPIFDAYPYLSLLGTRGSGKTKVLEIVSRLAFNAEMTSNATPSAIFRIIEANASTILIDEGEMLSSREDSQELRLILNAGYRRNNPVCRTHKETHEVQWFNVFSPKVIAAINPLDPTLRTRCLQITMVRTANKEKGNARINDNSVNWDSYRDSLYRYALQCMVEVREILEHDTAINLLENRQNELWSPMLAVAKHLNLYVTSTVFDDLKNKALQQQSDEDALDDWHRAVLLALDALVTVERQYTVKEVRSRTIEYFEDKEEQDRISSRWIGSALSRFGLKKGKRQENGNTYVIARPQIDDLMKRYQLNTKDEHPEHTEG